MIVVEPMSPNVEAFLAHYGVKGMRWGIRKKRPDEAERKAFFQAQAKGLNVLPKGVKVGADGSITIQPGASLQRLVRSNGKSAPMEGLTYASMLEYDNARYIKTIGNNGLLSFGQGRDQILHIQATKKITAPSKDEATRMVSDMMLNNPEFRKRNTVLFGGPIGDKELNEIRNDPGGKTAKAWYEMTNTKMTLSGDFDPDAPFVKTMLRERLEATGHNALRDENDAGGRKPLAKAPIIIFSPENSLKVTKVTNITDDLRKANKETLAAYKNQGQEWLESQMYGSSQSSTKSR